MANLNDMILRAEEKTKKKLGATSVETTLIPIVSHRNDEDSPTSLFMPEAVEESALKSVQRLINLWDSKKDERELEFENPEQYINEANRLFNSYKGLRIKIDSAVAYSIGDTLNSCRERFFKEGSSETTSWTRFIQSRIKFSLRIAYDFMNISRHLSQLKGRNLSMDQFRAALSLVSSGTPVDVISDRIEAMTAKEILSLRASKSSSKILLPQQILANLKVQMVRVEEQISAFNAGIKARSPSDKQHLSDKEKSEIRVLQMQLQSIFSILDELTR